MKPFDDKSKRVSIVLPVYNGARFLRESIDSCLQQTYRNIELVIVDDGSKDNSVEIVESYDDNRIKLIRHQINKKLPAALNTGFENTSGAYLTWTSHDNYYAATAVAEMVDFLERNPQVHFVFSDDYLVDEADQFLGVIERGPVERLPAVSCLGGCFLYRRAVYEKVGAYNEQTFLAEDYDYWLRVSAYFTLAHLNRPLYYYRQHADSLTRRYGGGETIEAAVAVQRQLLGKDLWRNRVLISQGHLSAASAFYDSNRRSSAARNTFWAIILNPKCLFNRRAQFILTGLCLGQRALQILSRLKQSVARAPLHGRLPDEKSRKSA
jgi:glycosyltransferase involved in cell wall biosynthesis